MKKKDDINMDRTPLSPLFFIILKQFSNFQKHLKHLEILKIQRNIVFLLNKINNIHFFFEGRLLTI